MIYDILYRTLIGAKPLHIIFDKIDGFIRVYNGTRYLVLFGPEKHDIIYNKSRYPISQKNSMTYLISHSNARIKVDLCYFLPPERHWSCMIL